MVAPRKIPGGGGGGGAGAVWNWEVKLPGHGRPEAVAAPAPMTTEYIVSHASPRRATVTCEALAAHCGAIATAGRIDSAAEVRERFIARAKSIVRLTSLESPSESHSPG